MRDEVRAAMKAIDHEISLLMKAKAAMEAIFVDPPAAPVVRAAKGALEAADTRRRRGGFRAPTMSVPLRLGLIDVLKQAGRALTIPEIMPALERLGWRTESPNKRGMVSVELGKMSRRKEIMRHKTTPRKYALGAVKPKPARPPKREPWEKKLASAKAMVAASADRSDDVTLVTG